MHIAPLRDAPRPGAVPHLTGARTSRLRGTLRAPLGTTGQLLSAPRFPPAHLSVVYPFVPPGDVDGDVLAGLASAIGTVPAFDCTFARTDWFGDDVLWLAPEPDAPFRELTRAVVAAFPAHRPYGGLYEEPAPHLTVGELRLGSARDLAAAERAVQAHLPIRARVERVVLLAGRPERDSWRPAADFRLG